MKQHSSMVSRRITILVLFALMTTTARAGGSDTPSDTTAVVDSLGSLDDFRLGCDERATLYGDRPLTSTRLDPVRATAVGAAMTGVLISFHVTMKNAWWDNRTSFNFKDDWNDVLQVDKAGHAFAGYMESYAFSEMMMGAGVAWKMATLIGGLVAFCYQTYVELEDGFSEGWGFSMTDVASNGFGAGLYIAQGFVPALGNIRPKYQFVPAGWLDVPRLSTTWIDDYNSSTFWLSTSPRCLAGDRLEWWPVWLNIALGYGVRINGDEDRARRVILALDYNLIQLLPDGGHVWNWLRQTLDHIKFPSPAIEFSPEPRLFLAFPF